jgi:L-rhamnose mutarotase
MHKVAFVMKIKEECMDEYVNMHENIWPEMKEVLKAAGRSNYSIWHICNMVFGYYEVENYDMGRKIIMESDVFAKWNKEISTMLDRDDGLLNGNIHNMNMIFYLE